MPDGSDFTLWVVADYLEINSRYGITEAADYVSALENAATQGERSSLLHAQAVHALLGDRQKMPFYDRPSENLARLDDETAQRLLKRRYSKTAIAKLNAELDEPEDRYRKDAGNAFMGKSRIQRREAGFASPELARENRRDTEKEDGRK